MLLHLYPTVKKWHYGIMALKISAGKGADKVKGRKQRSDRKHRFHLRIDETAHNEMDALAFRHNVSLNVAYAEAVLFCLSIAPDSFSTHLQDKFPRDTSRGHFTYHTDTSTKRLGRRI